MISKGWVLDMDSSKRIMNIIGVNIRRYFDSGYSPIEQPTDYGIADFLGYDRELYPKIVYHQYNMEFRTISRFAFKMNVVFPSLFSREFMKNLVLYRNTFHESNISDKDNDKYLDNFTENIRICLEVEKKKISYLYNAIPHNSQDSMSSSPSKSTIYSLLNGSHRNPTIKVLEWLTLCAGCAWDEMGLLFLNPSFLSFNPRIHKFQVLNPTMYHPFLQHPDATTGNFIDFSRRS